MPHHPTTNDPLPSYLGHRPVVPPRRGRHPGPLDEDLVKGLAEYPTADLSDAVGRLYTMSGGLHPLHPSMPRLIGTALTVKAPPGDNWAVHGAFELVTPGTVIVVDWRGATETCGAGAAALRGPVERGLSGIVVDGAWRDVEEVVELGLPILGTGVTPYSPPKCELGEINVPVSCGGVVVCPGDLVVGDGQGVVVVPREHVRPVLDSLRTRWDDIADMGGEHVGARAVASAYWAQFARYDGVEDG